MSPSSTLSELMVTVRALPEADRVRVLRFALAILQDRQGKRERRRSRFQGSNSAIDSWRIGQ